MVVVIRSGIPLEDELGDVLEKALRHAGLRPDRLAANADVDLGRIRDVLDYRGELTAGEINRLAHVLGLNEVGLCALGQGAYPLPEMTALPFCLYPLRMTHGIGVVNAYIVAESGSSHGLLFDVGASYGELERVWPRAIKQIDGLFLTHVEGEHTGGLCDVVSRFGLSEAHCPLGAEVACSSPLGEGQEKVCGNFIVTAYSTPGHAQAHNCYSVRLKTDRKDEILLVTGDLIFAGSVGCGFHDANQLKKQARRMLQWVKPQTVLAPGHGPLTNAENELRFNPFIG